MAKPRWIAALDSGWVFAGAFPIKRQGSFQFMDDLLTERFGFDDAGMRSETKNPASHDVEVVDV